jgi:CspA family cold shock protein
MADSGTIKWFSNVKGFGFIVNENGTQDIFVHHSSIIGNG